MASYVTLQTVLHCVMGSKNTIFVERHFKMTPCYLRLFKISKNQNLSNIFITLFKGSLEN